MYEAPFSFIGAGDILLDIFDASGASTGLQLKGDSPDFSVKTDSDIKQQTKHGRDNYGQVGASASLPKPASGEFTMNEVDSDLFAAAFYGSSAAYTQSSGTVDVGTPQTITSIADRFVETGKKMISNVVVKDETDTTTFVVDVDYKINPRLGAIMALSSGSIPAGANLHLSYDFDAITGTTISGMTKSQVKGRVVVDGVEFSSGKDFIFDGYQARLTVNGSVPIKGTDFIQVKFTVTFETPAGKTAPFSFTWLS